jgi:GH15 family glucan-1,4-alpha-glucosidase
MIGDGRSAALIGQDGALDWLCLPRFDSPSFFGALLDRSAGGTFCIHPTGPWQSTRRYVPDSNVLETTFVTERGACILRDLMPVASEEDKRGRLLPDHQVLREPVCLSLTARIVLEANVRTVWSAAPALVANGVASKFVPSFEA